MNDEHYMQRCLDLAEKGLGRVAPNPMVGCVIVKDGEIIGEGYHQKFGEPHAEVNAIRSVADQSALERSVLYVNLEPCAHHGKTPPCADLIIEKKIPKVVIGSNDPNPKVAGKGIAKLLGAGIEVVEGVLKEKAAFLNRRFITFYTKHRPYIILKWAQSSDGFIAPNEPKQVWLTGEVTRKLVHTWRSEEQAILIGRKTLEIDKPLLTVRLVQGKSPLRIVIGRNFSLPIDPAIANAGSRMVLFNDKVSITDGPVHAIKIDFGANVLQQVFNHLVQHQIQSVIVEGGLTTLQTFIDAGLWDEACVFTAPVELKEGRKSPAFVGHQLYKEQIGEDRLDIFMRK